MRITMPNQNQFARRTAVVLMASGLIASLLPGLAAPPPGGLLSVEWLHPITGKSSAAETVAGGARRRFTAPAGEPVVLLLRNVSRD